MNTYITSDLHFGHKNIMGFNPNTRPYTDVTHMNESMVREWNQVVKEDDHTYVLGDVAFMKPSKAAAMIRRLNGTKTLIIGNHDHESIKSEIFRDCFIEMHYYLEIDVNRHKVILCHYPIYEWNGMHRGSIHLHGHTHGFKTGLEKDRICDVGVDATGKIVVPLVDIVEQVAQNEIRSRSRN